VRVKLEANQWKSDELWPIRESVEFLASELPSQKILWEFIEEFELCTDDEDVDKCMGSISTTNAEVAVFEKLVGHLSNADQRALKLALAYRVHLPAVISHSNAEQATTIGDLCTSANKDDNTSANAWGLLNGVHPICSAEELVTMISSCSATDSHSKNSCHEAGYRAINESLSLAEIKSLLLHDYIYPSASLSSATSSTYNTWLVVFGTVGTPEFLKLFTAAREAVMVGTLQTLSVRHAPTHNAFSKIVPEVPGFGVALDIKNMEYKTIDDREVGDADGTDQKIVDTAEELKSDESEVNGIFFSKLVTRRPELAEELHALKSKLVAATAASASEVKVWNMRNIGLAAAQRIVRMTEGHRGSFDSALSKMLDLSQNFPLHAASLTSDKISHEINDEISGRAQPTSQWHRLGVNEGSNALWINGASVGSPESTVFDVHEVIRTIVNEHKLTNMFKSLPLSDALRRSLQSMASRGFSAKSGQPRIDVRAGAKGALHFFNNLEKDNKYKHWERHLAQILQPSWQLPQIAANFYTAIIVVDPSTPMGLRAITDALELYNANMPVRIGLCLTDGVFEHTSNDVLPPLASDLESLVSARHVVRLLQAAKAKYSHRTATIFLEYLTNQAFGDGVAVEEVADSERFTVQRLIEVFAKAAKYAQKAWRSASYAQDAQDILNGISYEDKKGNVVETLDEQFTLARRFTAMKGFLLGHVTINGMLDSTSRLDGSIQNNMNLVISDMRNLQKLVSMGKLKDGDNILASLLKKSSYPRFHKDIFSTKFNSEPVLFPANGNIENAYAPLATQPFFYGSRAAAHAEAAVVSFAVVSNWDSLNGVNLACSALEHLLANGDTNNASSDEKNNGHDFNGLDFFALHRAAIIDSGLRSTIKGSTQQIVLHTLHRLAETQRSTTISDEIHQQQELRSAVRILNLLREELNATDEDLDHASASLRAAVAEISGNIVIDTQTEDDLSTIVSRQAELRGNVFGLESGTNAVVVNGHLVSAQHAWQASDFELLASMETKSRAKKVGRYLQQQLMPSETDGADVASIPAALKAGAFATICATLGLYSETTRKVKFPDPVKFPYSSIAQQRPDNDSGGDNAPMQSHSVVEIVAVIDPISEAAQRLVPVLQSLQDFLGNTVHLTIFLNPETNINEFPLERYFRFAAPTTSGLASSSTSNNNSGNDTGLASLPLVSTTSKGVVFSSLPGHQVLTMKIETPEPWIVPVTYAQYDMDNLQLHNCGPDGAAVTLSLTDLLVTGSCDDLSHGQPPNGLQLHLVPAGGLLNVQREREHDAEAYSDTLVMQNLGYYQLKANPGTWRLRLAGRSEELYEILDAGGEAVKVLPIHVRSFGGQNMQLEVRKRPGMEDEELLTASPEEIAKAEAARAAARRRRREDSRRSSFLGDLFSSVMGDLDDSPAPSLEKDTPSVTTVVTDSDGSVHVEGVGDVGDDRFDGRIHVFSLASGRVYERLLSIMMLSVSRRASMPVTFWLVENFLSPEFKESLPKLTQEFGYRVELITYKWPSWLRQQTEKQRIIWGYKILFLDVLFPLDLKKVIYVDADQVVRADLKELWDMDLQGHAYGYTPFCDSNKETLGFQFWRQGYWAEHLRGRPYHISALYVVDLVQFRRQAVGDQLRATYSQLSRDPNSLSNLDQDLPNYVQPQVPIFSLPQEWLWCESWCSLESKADAKTIDLCNHPATKEPKLNMAKRIISGELFHESWVELDALVAEATESAALS
jgi:UDP-glucose:glycoprotein glucosyltransferase